MISKHISDREGVYSITATRRGLDNTPNAKQLSNMKLLAEKVFEPLREWVGGPIRINSQAMDIDDGGCNKTNAQMYKFIKDELEFDQMIWEFGTDDNPNWVHVSYVSEEKNRNRCLLAYKENNKTKYKVI